MSKFFVIQFEGEYGSEYHPYVQYVESKNYNDVLKYIEDIYQVEDGFTIQDDIDSGLITITEIKYDQIIHKVT